LMTARHRLQKNKKNKKSVKPVEKSLVCKMKLLAGKMMMSSYKTGNVMKGHVLMNYCTTPSKCYLVTHLVISMNCRTEVMRHDSRNDTTNYYCRTVNTDCQQCNTNAAIAKTDAFTATSARRRHTNKRTE
jgi:hypothetical protein